MKGLAAPFPLALALGATILVPGARAGEPTKIRACQMISHAGSYELADNLVATGDCLVITADFVTIDLAGFTISGPGGSSLATAIGAGNNTTGITVRNGSISGFVAGVDLGGDGSIVEGVRVSGSGVTLAEVAISANGIVRGNTVVSFAGGGPPVSGIGISATGVVTGNFVGGARHGGMQIGEGSTVIGNNITHSLMGLIVSCPSNVTDNTAVNNGSNLMLNGTGCNNTNNVAP